MNLSIRRQVSGAAIGFVLLLAGDTADLSQAVAQQPRPAGPGGFDLNNLDLNNLDLKNLNLQNLDFKQLNLQGVDMQQLQGLLEKIKRKKYPFPYENVEPGPPVPATVAPIWVEFDPRLGIIVPEGRKTADVVGIPQGPGVDLGSPAAPAPDLGAPAPNLGNPQPNLGNPQPNLGNPQPNLGNPQPNLGNPQPNLGDPAPNLEPDKSPASPAVPNLGKPSATPDGDEPPAPQPDGDLGPQIPVPQRAGSDDKRDADAQQQDVPAAEPQPAEEPGPAGAVAEDAAEPPPYLIVPGRHTRRVAGFRTMIPRGQPGEPLAFPEPPANDGAGFLELQPVWHADVPRYFHPAAGLHVFAIVHPFTFQTVCVQVYLPEGRPVVEVDRNDLEFNYGRYEVEIEFERDGRVDVKYGD